MSKVIRIWVCAIVLAACASASQASAEVITFSGMTDYTNFSEAGMAMTSSSVWNYPGAGMAHMDSGVASFVLDSGLNFNLLSVDMVDTGGTGPARFSAYLDGNLLGEIDVAGSAGTYFFGPLFQNIDELRVSVPGNHFTFDNLTFALANEVPEPASIALWGLASVAGIAAWRRRKAAKAT